MWKTPSLRVQTHGRASCRANPQHPRSSVKSSKPKRFRGKSRAAGTYGAAPGSGAGSDAVLSPALALGDRITHLCTNTAHMAQPRWKPGRGVGSQVSGLGQVLPKPAARQEGQGSSVKTPACCWHPAGPSPHPSWARGEGRDGGQPRRLLSQIRSKLILARLLVEQEKGNKIKPEITVAKRSQIVLWISFSQAARKWNTGRKKY